MRRSPLLLPLEWPHNQISKKIHVNGPLIGRPYALAKMMSWLRATEMFSGKIPRKMHKISPNRSNSTLSSPILSMLLFALIGLSIVISIASVASAAEHQKQNQNHPTAATNAYGEPIKWSFGGWAPLDGQQPPGAKRNLTATGSTTPLPPMDPANPHRTTAALVHQHSAAVARQSNRTMQQQQQQHKNGRRPGGESMNESASSTHGKVQFVAPQPESVSYQSSAQQGNDALMRESQPHQHRHQIHSGPAYALSMQRQTHFSPPAPMPIIREHLLPSAANYHRQQGQAARGGSLGPHDMPHHGHRHHQHRMHAQASQQQYPRPPVSMYEHQRRLEHQHRQQMMHHHQMMMQHPHLQPNNQMMPQPSQASGRHPARFPQQSAPVIEGYRVVEGEHPIIFMPPAGMMELAAPANSTNQQQQQHTASSHAPYTSALPANDKDNLNYQSALRQVSSANSYDSQQSNNIQDIKQKQQQQQQQQQQYEQPQQQQIQPDKQQQQPEHHKAGFYLTIPVAVETEGDKVLTADDINEIEKHVIQVLPNLKTADKVVKLADTKLHLAAANLKDARQIHSTAGPAALHQLNYEEHRSTMKQLENDLTGNNNNNKQYSQQYDSATTATPSSSSSAAAAYSSSQQVQQHSSPALNQATTMAHVQHQQPKSIDDGQQQQHEHAEHQYFLATGPMQEVGTVDSDQLAEYNLIKNDLLQNFRYEPTRASGNGNAGAHQQTASTPPMPYTASQSPSSPSSAPPQHKPASVTRYFQQGNRMYQQHQLDKPTAGQQRHNNQYHNPNNLFGRIQTPAYSQQQQQQQGSTTKTILGGRKVSEVMRNLIHTTPVPMTSPMHVPSIEPEKLDAIQLIASHGNDNKPMVVEPHQLVQHTPEGGFDYNSGGMNSNNNHNNSTGGQQQQQQYDQQNGNADGQRAQYGSPAVPQMMEPQPNGGDNQQQQPGGAIIEYVSVGEQALNGVLGAGQHEGTYEIANQPEVQPVYHSGEEEQNRQQHQQANPNDGMHSSSRAPFVYDYTMSADQQQTASPGSEQSGPTTYSMSPSSMQQHRNQQQQQQQPQQGGEPQMFTWSPSIANEHQQQQAELSEHAAPGHQMDMPATAGYNFFGQSGEQQQSKETGQEYEQQQSNKWRSKAGGSQPNPDAQYDGQIVKGGSDHGSDHDEAQNNNQPAADEQQQYNSPTGYRGQADNEQPSRLSMETRQPENQGDSERDGYQQKQHQQQEQQSPTTPANQQVGDGYLATNSYAAGVQINHQTPSHGTYDQQQQQEYDQSRQQPARYNYVKLDHDRQQSHLVQQQAQRQAQMADIMSNNNEQHIYQTTTPVTLTTLASVDATQQRQAGEDQTQTQQQQLQSQSDYGQDQSLPSVQSSPESMLINESPISMPILDQQSLISDPNQEDSNHELSSDDGAKQTQPAAVYQVYQAYYAPKDHKPLPGYVRLSLEEFNELFRDAEIQYVDRNNLNGIATGQRHLQSQEGPETAQHTYDRGGNHNDLMKASSSELNQSIVVDRRSITPERRFSNSNSTATATDADNSETNRPNPRKLEKFGGAVKKIISIRNSRQAARQQLLKGSILKHKPQQQQQEKKKSNTQTTSSTTTLSPSASSNPTTKQRPNVSTTTAIITHNQKSINKQQQSANKRKSSESGLAPAKKSLSALPSQPMKGASISKDSKIEKPMLISLVDGAGKRSTSTTTDKSGSKIAR